MIAVHEYFTIKMFFGWFQDSSALSFCPPEMHFKLFKNYFFHGYSFLTHVCFLS